MSATSTAFEWTRVSPIGLRFYDTVTQDVVRDGLVITVASAEPPVRVVVNPSGVFILSGLPGLAATEASSGDTSFWASPPLTASFRVTVDDVLGRFLPCSFTVEAPTRGIAQPPCPAALAAASGFSLPAAPLFSSVARSFPSGVGIVRAQLWDMAAQTPASNASLTVKAGAPAPVVGLADKQGRVALAFPYPPLPTNLGSPPVGNALNLQVWSVGISVSYDPAVAVSGPADHPDLCALLTQPAVQALATQSPPVPLTTASIAYGTDLVLRTDGGSLLLVDRGGSA
jgi:hypothetical protein